MRIIYAYELDAADINTQSGRPFSILRQLERRAEVIRIFPLRQHVRYLYAGTYLHRRQRGETYRPDREPRLLRSLARQIERRARGVAADVVFAPGSHVMAELDLPLPKIFLADATFANVCGFYDSFTDCAPEFVAQGHAMDRKALANCDAAIYPSQWAARSAIEDYGAPPSKVYVIPWGANVAPPDAATVRAQIEARGFDQLRLLFVGRAWFRKGGDIVLATCEELRRRGVPLHLDLVGLPRVPVDLPPYARSLGLLDKNDPRNRERLDELFAKAHVFFMPSRAENYGIVFCEAAAFGVPSVASDVGGIPTIVRDGETGFTLPSCSAPGAFADKLQIMFAHPQRYRAMALASLNDFLARLNWDVFATRLFQLMRDLVALQPDART
jgi:glycosyltransferase involved in cell wall biosynthesis